MAEILLNLAISPEMALNQVKGNVRKNALGCQFWAKCFYSLLLPREVKYTIWGPLMGGSHVACQF